MRLTELLGIGRKYAPIPDFSAQSFDPFDPASGGFKKQPILCTIEMARLRGLQPLAFGYDDSGRHPYVLSLADSLVTGRPSYAGSALEYFYEIWRPANAAELLGLTGPDTGRALREMSPEIRVWPWIDTAVETLLGEHRAFVDSFKGKLYPGKQFNGPKSAEVGSRNYRRLVKVMNAIRRWGYWRTNRDTGDIDGIVLTRGRDWTLFVLRGQHRSAALAALGYRKALVRVLNAHPVDRDQVEAWPNVRNGLFTAREAAQLFDRIFEARQPPNFPWLSWSSFDTRSPFLSPAVSAASGPGHLDRTGTRAGR